MSYQYLISEGGVLIYPLLFCGALGFLICLERLFFWLKAISKFNTEDVEQVYTFLVHKQYEDAKSILESSDDPSLICLLHCISSKGRIHGPILQSLAQQKIDQSKKHLKALETIINVSPLLGILGTVIGIIESVTSLNTEASQAFDSQVMISGLSQALLTTALGLIISISCLVAYGYFTSQLDRLKAKLERDLSAFESLVTPS